ncbi:MAG: hypothetical protein ACYDIE_13785 [Candidatus Krumholzibacteriia bacterium]
MKRTIALSCLILGLAATAAVAGTVSPGIRGGITFDPDQVHLGAHLYAGEMFPHGYFVPNVEIGFGDNVTVVALNPELLYRFERARGADWGFYAGGGLGVNFYSWDSGRIGDDSNTELGLNVVGGATRGLSSGNELFLEVKFGLADSPDGKLTVGLTFF